MCWCVLCMGLHVFVKVVLGIWKHHLDIIGIYNCQFTQRWMSHCISFSFSGTIYIYVNQIFSPHFTVWSRNSGSPASWGFAVGHACPSGQSKNTIFNMLPHSPLISSSKISKASSISCGILTKKQIHSWSKSSSIMLTRKSHYGVICEVARQSPSSGGSKYQRTPT